MAHVNDSVGEGEFVAASGGLLIMQGVGAAAGPLLAGFVMSAFEQGQRIHSHCDTNADGLFWAVSAKVQASPARDAQRILCDRADCTGRD